jgi:hypothetical protein
VVMEEGGRFEGRAVYLSGLEMRSLRGLCQVLRETRLG